VEAKLTFEIDKQTVHVALAHVPVGSRSEAEIGMMGFITTLKFVAPNRRK
jgi:hypothetical protein